MRPSFVELLTRGVREHELWWDDSTYDEVPEVLAALHDRRPPSAPRDGTRRRRRRRRAGGDAALARLIGIEVDVDQPGRRQAIGGRNDSGSTRSGASPSTMRNITSIRGTAPGIAAVVLDRWGTYAGDRRSVRDLVDFVDLVDGLAAATTDGTA